VDLTNKDGEVGSARVWAISLLCVVSLAIVALGSTVVWRPISVGDATVKGTCNVTSDDAGTATLTVDAVAGALTGDVAGDLTGDDINMSGAVSDTLGFNDTKAVTVTGLTATVNFANITASGGGKDTDYVNYKWLTMDNDSSESVDWAYWYVVVDDETTNTEDTAVELYIQVGGVATKALDVNASGLAVTALNTGTGEATVDGKYAVVGGDATTGLMIQKGDGAAVTNGATVTFPTVFGGVPTVILGADESTTTVPYPSSVTASNFVVNGEAAKVQNWIAVGTRP
jgi:hypothetical protein